MLVASVCVAMPSLVAAVQAIRWGWVPVSDQATISTRAAEVLTGRTPRVGQLSGASAEVGLPTRSPGPMGYWPFAVTSRWGPLWGTAVVAAALSGAAMVASVRLAARRGGPALALAVAGGLILAARSINPANLASTWNPAVGVMPLVLLVFLAWSLADGEVWLLPVAALVASFCAQVHTVLVLPAALLLAVGAGVGLAPSLRRGLSAVRARRLGRPRPGRVGRAVLAALAVLALCWALPLLDQVTGDPGNMTRLSRANPDDPLEWTPVRNVVVDVVGVVPAFLEPDPLPEEQATDVFYTEPTGLAVVTTALVVVGLAALAGWARLRRRSDVGVPVVLALVLLVACIAVARSTPGEQFLVLTYTAWWMVPAGMLMWTFLVWGVGRATGAGAAVAGRLGAGGRSVGAGLAGAALVLVAVLAPGRAEPEEPIHDEARAVGDVVEPYVEEGERVLVAGQGKVGEQLVASTAYRIRRAGGRPIVPGNDGIGAGPRYAPKGKGCAVVITITQVSEEVPPGAEVLEELTVTSRHGDRTDVVVAMGPDDGPPSC